MQTRSMNRQAKLMTKVVSLLWAALLISAAVFAQDRSQKPTPKPLPPPAIDIVDPSTVKRPPSGPTFYIGRVEGSASMFSVLLGDSGGNTVAGTFTLQQIDVFEAVLEAARAFALTDEKVGSAAPITTRLMEQHEWSLFVDVSKIGDKSRFYISLVTPHGRMTTPAGEITRGSKKEQTTVLMDILSQIRDARGGLKSVQ